MNDTSNQTLHSSNELNNGFSLDAHYFTTFAFTKFVRQRSGKMKIFSFFFLYRIWSLFEKYFNIKTEKIWNEINFEKFQWKIKSGTKKNGILSYDQRWK